MKKAIVVAVAMASAPLITTQANAADVSTPVKQNVTAFGAMATGAIAGGPPGAIAGLVAGVWLANELGEAAELEPALAAAAASEDKLTDAESRVANLERSLQQAEQRQERLGDAMLESLEIALMFRTNESALSDQGKQQMASLTRYLTQNPDIQLAVRGYADQRGDDAANLALSEARAQAVAGALVEGGVAKRRIKVSAYGEQHADASPGEVDAMALERKVVIVLSRSEDLADRG